jgi:hypothetical protein
MDLTARSLRRLAVPMNMSVFTGTGVFGRAYHIMLERDVHACGSVDRMLAATMIRLCQETADHLYTAFTPVEVSYSILTMSGKGWPGGLRWLEGEGESEKTH